MSFLFCSEANDQTIGPGIRGCRDDFDFTVQFEQLFFSLSPSAVFVVLSVWRFIALTARPVVVEAPRLWLGKLAALVSYAALELALIVLAGVRPFDGKDVFISASSLRFAAALCMLPLSFLEHGRSRRPSVLLGAYLSLTLLLDAVQVRTFWLASSASAEMAYTAVDTAALALKLLLALLEGWRKDRWVKDGDKAISPEETSGIYSLGLYSWLNRLAISGYRKVLQIPDLYPLDNAIASERLHSQFASSFQSAKFRGRKHRLLLVLGRALVVPLLLPVPARLLLIGFALSQPFFIQSLVAHLARPAGAESANVGYGFIGASVLIYGGIALSTALYWYFHYRMLYMVRGSLVSAIYAKATEVYSVAGDENAPLTLMSTDIERINQGFRSLHEVWADAIQTSLAAYFLYRQIGPSFVVPIVVVTLCATCILLFVRYTANGQKLWMEALQRRVALTSSVVASMKNLKISGLAVPIGSFVQQLRVDELTASEAFRKLLLLSAMLAFTPVLTSPFLTFAVAQRTLDVASVYTSLSFIILMTQPLADLFQAIPRIVGAVTCLGRIQSFLQAESRDDYRVKSDNAPTTREKGEKGEKGLGTNRAAASVVIEKGSFGWSPGHMVLHDLDVTIPRGSLSMVVGPIGSGKSSLCKAILGELPQVRGKISVDAQSARVGFCEQTPFLLNGSIRENIIGFSPFDAAQYAGVIDATLLGPDCEALPEGHDTVVGSNGIALSGGQKQRVSLARALYLHADLLVFDDIFSGLDADTEDQVFERVFGRSGLLRKRNVTSVLCTHSIRHLPAADQIIALELGGRVREQGTFADLNSHGESYVRSLGVTSSTLDCEPTAGDRGDSGLAAVPSTAKQKKAAAVAQVTGQGARLVGDSAVYKIYFGSLGWWLTGMVVFMAVVHAFFDNFANVWLSYWATDAVEAHPAHSNSYYIGLYSLFQILGLLSVGVLVFLLMVTGVSRAGAMLHQTALHTLVHAPLRFFFFSHYTHGALGAMAWYLS
ncbi:hypothetical protein F5Y17DRAFT_469176 [Xylariaceae sp. FL0594]|nr:hypothetical protein F5Y17DRAFT_469176 [Xylariaceae sp. FL0594]